MLQSCKNYSVFTLYFPGNIRLVIESFYKKKGIFLKSILGQCDGFVCLAQGEAIIGGVALLKCVWPR